MASRGLTVALATLVLGGLIGVGPAGAEQLNAKDDPKVSSNLTLGGKKCATQRDKHGGHVVAVIHSCQRFFAFDADGEDDANRDYGVLWLQSTIDPAEGWCATAVSSDMLLPTGLRIEAKAPESASTIDAAQRLKTKLAVDADGHAATNGSVSQASRVYPSGLTPSTKKIKGKTKFRLKWTGSNDHELAFVSGVEVSWMAADGPPEGTRFGLRRYTLVEKESC
jgi:hypothetical protein